MCVMLWFQFINDLERDRKYSSWPSSVQDLLRPTFPGMLRHIRKNLYHMVTLSLHLCRLFVHFLWFCCKIHFLVVFLFYFHPFWSFLWLLMMRCLSRFMLRQSLNVVGVGTSQHGDVRRQDWHCLCVERCVDWVEQCATMEVDRARQWWCPRLLGWIVPRQI